MRAHDGSFSEIVDRIIKSVQYDWQVSQMFSMAYFGAIFKSYDSDSDLWYDIVNKNWKRPHFSESDACTL